MSTKLIDEDGGWTVINNKMRDIWMRPLGLTAFGVWYTFKSFCAGINGTNIFPEVSEEDWALRIGISTPTFITSIQKLQEFGLLEIIKPPDNQKYLPHLYILKKVPDKLSDEIKNKKITYKKYNKNNTGKKYDIVITNKNIIAPLPLTCRFTDPIFEKSNKIFRSIKEIEQARKEETKENKNMEEQEERDINNFNDPLLKNFNDIYTTTELKSPESNNINIINKDFSNPVQSFKQPSSRRKSFNPLPEEIQEKRKQSQNKIFTRDQQTVKPPKVKKVHITEDDWKYKIVQEWNKIPQVTKHKKMDTDIAQNISVYLDSLKDGTFFNQCIVKQDYLKWNKVPLEWVQKNRPFSQREIMNAVKDFAKDFINGYEPKNKKFVPTRLDIFLFNTNTGSSWFLKCVANPDPKPIAEERKNTDPNPQYTKPFKERKLLRFFEEKDYPSIYQSIQRLKNKVIEDKIFDFSLPNPDRCRLVGQGKGQLEPMFRNYAQYLNDTYNEIHEPDKIFYFYGYFKDYLEDLALRFRWVNIKNF